MIDYRSHHVSIMVLYAVTLHLWWALMILIGPSALDATGVHAINLYVQSPGALVVILTGAALLAFIGISTNTAWVVLLLLPQQVLLMMSAAGCVEAIWLSQFADGVIRDRPFISADQFYSFNGAVWHTAAIVSHALRIGRQGPSNGT